MTNRLSPVMRYPQTETETPRAKLANLEGQIRHDEDQMRGILDRTQGDTLSKGDAEALERIEKRLDERVEQRRQLLREYPAIAPPSNEEIRAAALPAVAPMSIGRSVRDHAADSNLGLMTQRALERDTSGAFSADDVRSFSLGRLVQGLATGNVDSDSVERRALSEGTDSAGGFLVPAPLASSVIDRLRPATRVIEAGAKVVPMESDTLYVPRISEGVEGAWRAEGDSVATDAPTFDRVVLSPKSLAVAVKVSNELLQDLTSAGSAAIERELINALAVQVDQAALNGTGLSNEPTGIVNTTGVTVNTNGTNGTTASWAMVSRAIKSVEIANATPTGVLAAPRTWHTLDGLTDTTGQPLRAPEYASKVPAYSTNSIPTNLTVGSASTCSQIVAGDWSRLLIGVRPSIQVQVIADQSRYVDQLSTLLIAHIRCDIGVEQPAAFAVETGVK